MTIKNYITDNYYSSYTVKNLEKLFKSRDSLIIKAYYGGEIDALELLVDIELIIKECNFSDNQLQILQRYYFEGHTQVVIAEGLGLTQQGVMKRIYSIRRKLKKIITAWGE